MNFEIADRFVEHLKPTLNSMSDAIWEYAELGFEEVKSSNHLKHFLDQNGFTVIDNLANIATSFSASFGEGKPIIGILGEYDALEHMAQTSMASEKDSDCFSASGHGCGHHLLGTAGAGACVAIKEFLTKRKIPGTIKFFGCPAEEGGAAKIYMTKEGCFQDLDAVLTWHPSSMNAVFDLSTNANMQAYFKFKGIASHAAVSPHLGRSALDAVELMNVGCNYLREHIVPEGRVHYAVINSGGKMANIVQSDANVLYLVRAPKRQQVKEIYDRIVDVARGAALMTGTELTIEFDSGMSEYIPNRTINEISRKNMELLLPTLTFSDETIAFAKRFSSNIPPLAALNTIVKDEQKAKQLFETGLCTSILPVPSSTSAGSTDVGDVSHIAPTSQIGTACSTFGVSLHSWEMVSQGKSEIAHSGMLLAAKIMAATAMDLMEHQELCTNAREELNAATGGAPYESPIPYGVNPHKPLY